MIQIETIDALEQLVELKRGYMQQTTAPLDGMWLTGFVPLANHYGLSVDGERIGFFCVNADGCLLQFFVQPPHQHQASRIFAQVLRGHGSPAGAIKAAFASTAEPRYLGLCLDQFPNFEVNALMYQLDDARGDRGRVSGSAGAGDLALSPIGAAQLAAVVEFAVASLGAPATWLASYFSNLVNRRELFGVWDGGRLIATGESRRSDELQEGYADVGVIVAEAERGRGIATWVLGQLVALNEANGVRSICSTENGNVAAQRAISRAGFSPRNRIVRFDAA